jgi:hypothetical protein
VAGKIILDTLQFMDVRGGSVISLSKIEARLDNSHSGRGGHIHGKTWHII